jgi:hypothetical protein
LEFAEHDLVNQERWRHSERDDVRQGIEFAPERTVVTAEAREPAIEQIEDAGGKDEPDCVVEFYRGDLEVDILSAIVNAQNGGEPAKEIARRH